MNKSSIIVHVDPMIGSTNLGDQVISEAVRHQLRAAFPSSSFVTIASRDVGLWAKYVMSTADYVFLGGTNALSSNPIFGYRQISLGRLSTFSLQNVVLLGVGWWQYQDGFGPFAKTFYKKLLRSDCTHSVRDEYTKRKLLELGFRNVLNTSCPTMWDLRSFTQRVGNTAVITLTDYLTNKARDIAIVKNAMAKFENVYFWPQGVGDFDYLQSLGQDVPIKGIRVLDPTLAAFNEVLRDRPCYAGTRLHGGIRALQLGCPAFIVPIDNRAAEIAKTENLPLVDSNLEGVTPGAEFRFTHRRNDEIDAYLSQFSNRHARTV